MMWGAPDRSWDCPPFPWPWRPSCEQLQRRIGYGGRKGRSAARRVRARDPLSCVDPKLCRAFYARVDAEDSAKAERAARQNANLARDPEQDRHDDDGVHDRLEAWIHGENAVEHLDDDAQDDEHEDKAEKGHAPTGSTGRAP